MAGMPDWFAKTKEMIAVDKHFSLADAKNQPELVRRYRQALARVASTPTTFATKSDALDGRMPAAQINASLFGHFAGDWVHALYFTNPKTYGSLGGLYWPSIPSTTVVDQLRGGIELAIHKALGDQELAKLGFTQQYRDVLWSEERLNGVDVDGVVPLAMSWNCVAPTGSDFFDVAALRGPSVVEYAIATPQPFGISMSRRLLSMVGTGALAVREAAPAKRTRAKAAAGARKQPAKKR